MGPFALRAGVALVAVAIVTASGVTQGQSESEQAEEQSTREQTESPSAREQTEGSESADFDRFVGTYRAVDLDEQKTTIDEAIEKGTEEMRAMRQRVGRKRLHAVNKPVQVLRIIEQGDDLVTEYDGKRYVAPKSGEAQRARDPEGKPVTVSYRTNERSLRARYVGPDGEKIMQFRPSGDDRLTMYVTLLSDQLPEPIRYSLEFRRD